MQLDNPDSTLDVDVPPRDEDDSYMGGWWLAAFLGFTLISQNGGTTLFGSGGDDKKIAQPSGQ